MTTSYSHVLWIFLFGSVRSLGEQNSIYDPCVIDFLFVVDGSDSVKDAFRPQMDFVQNVVKRLTIGPEYQRTAMIQYSTDYRMRVEFNFTTHKTLEGVENALDNVPYMNGLTDTREALQLAKQLLADRRAGAPAYVFVITDAYNRHDPADAAAELRTLPDVTVLGIGISKNTNMDEMRRIIENDDNFYTWQNVTAVLDRIARDTKCVLTTTTTTTPTTTTTIPARCIIDLLLIMDSSGSELRAFFNTIDISKQMVALLNIGPINAHVAQVRFASYVRSRIDYDFNKFYDKTELIEAISNTRIINGTTNIDRSLELALDLFNDPKYGARPSGHSRRIAVMFTDGYTLNQDRIKNLAHKLVNITDNFWIVGVSAIPANLDAYFEMHDNANNIFTEAEDPDFKRFRQYYESELGGCLEF